MFLSIPPDLLAAGFLVLAMLLAVFVALLYPNKCPKCKAPISDQSTADHNHLKCNHCGYEEISPRHYRSR
jgi:hypothetical protein